MQVRDYWRVLTKRWWVFVLVVLAAAATAYGYSKAQRPVFRATAVLRVEPARTDWGLTLVVERTLRQYGRMLQTSLLASRVNRELSLDLTPERLQSQVKVSPIPEDLLIQIDVEDPDPGVAWRIAKTLAQIFVEDQQIRMAPNEPRDRINVELLDEPKPAVLERPKTRVNVIAGAVLGLLVAAILAFGLEFLDDTVKTAEDVERYVGAPAIGTIPRIETARSSPVRRSAHLTIERPEPQET